LSPGVEWRRLWAGTGVGRERLTLVRLDPDQIRLRVIYQPAHPRRVGEWARVLPEALLVVNAGYFTSEMQATGLIVSDGVSAGRSYDDFAGMLAVGAGGQVSLRWLRTSPFDPDEGLAQAVQSFPVLVKPGGVMGFPPDADEGQRSRRTVVAQDTAGRIILLASPMPRFSLHELAIWLTESDLELEIAMNLDGGTSTGLWIKSHANPIDSLVPVPAVIAVEPAGR
jgi:exopolysaccharide biosynthesis protein